MKWLAQAIFLAIAALPACKTAGPAQVSDISSTDSGPKILFLTFSVATDSLGVNNFSLTQQTVAEGSPKKWDKPVTSPDRLTIALVNSSGDVLATASLDHPLQKNMEYPTPGGYFERKSITLTESAFFVRLPYPSGAVAVQVEEWRDGSKIGTARFKLL